MALMQKKFLIAVFFLLFSFSFLNLGKWLDVTEKPQRSDIIVCLGGGTLERVKKSIELYKNGYAKHREVIILGESWYNQPYLKKNYPNISVSIDESPKNTQEEVHYCKNC